MKSHSYNLRIFIHNYYLDIIILSCIPIFYFLLHLSSSGFDLMYDDNLRFFSSTFSSIQLISQGLSPVRDPYLYLDLLRAGNSSLLYLPQYIFNYFSATFFPDNITLIKSAWTTLHFFHLTLPAVSSYLFLRYFKFSKFASLFGSIIYGWNLYMTIMGGIYTAHIRAVHYAAIPIMLVILDYSLKNKKYYFNIINGLVLSFAVLSGGTQPILYIIPFLYIYIIINNYFNKSDTFKNFLAGLIKFSFFIFVPFIFCTAPLLIDINEILPHLSRFNSEGINTIRFFLLKDFLPGIINPFYPWEYMQSFPWEQTRYFGTFSLPILLLGIMAFFIKSRQKRGRPIDLVFFLIFLITGFIAIYYSYLPESFLKIILLSDGIARYPFRIFSITLLSLSYFIAAGFDYLIKVKDRPRKTKWLFIYLIIFLSGLLISNIFFKTDSLGINSATIMIPITIASVTIVFFLKKRIFPILCIMIIIIDLTLVGYLYCLKRFEAYDFTQKDYYSTSFLRLQDQAWINKLPEEKLPYRTFILKNNNCNNEADIYSITGYQFNKLRHPFGYPGSIGLNSMIEMSEINNRDHVVFKLLGVKYFYNCEDESIILNNKALDLLTVFNDIHLVDNDDILRQIVSEGDENLLYSVYFTRTDTYLESFFSEADRSVNPEDIENVSIDVSEYTNIDIRLTYSNKTTGKVLLLLSEPWSPYWNATIDGDSVSIYKAYGFLQSIILDPGEHSVVFEYKVPNYLIIVSLISQTILLFFSILLIRVFFQKRRQKAIHTTVPKP